VALLAPDGKLFGAMHSADSDSIIQFSFPLERLPTHTQLLLATEAGRCATRPCSHRSSRPRHMLRSLNVSGERQPAARALAMGCSGHMLHLVHSMCCPGCQGCLCVWRNATFATPAARLQRGAKARAAVAHVHACTSQDVHQCMHDVPCPWRHRPGTIETL